MGMAVDALHYSSVAGFDQLGYASRMNMILTSIWWWRGAT